MRQQFDTTTPSMIMFCAIFVVLGIYGRIGYVLLTQGW